MSPSVPYGQGIDIDPKRIFLSSTASDLDSYRSAVAETVDHYGQVAVRMETFGARPGTSLENCCRLAANADALIVIVAHRYGWVPTPEEGGDGQRSVTWYEAEAALKAGKDLFAYIVNPAYPWSHPKEQDRLAEPGVDPVEVANAVKNLQKFKKHLSKHIREMFNDPADLAKKVSRDLGNWLLGQQHGVGTPVTIDISSHKITAVHYAKYAVISFSITNITQSPKKVSLYLRTEPATEINVVRLQKAGAILKEFDLEATLIEPGEIDLLAGKGVQIVLSPKESEAFRLCLHGEEGFLYTCSLFAVTRDLVHGHEEKVFTAPITAEFPIRSAAVLSQRRKRQ